mgnify:FL=1
MNYPIWGICLRWIDLCFDNGTSKFGEYDKEIS